MILKILKNIHTTKYITLFLGCFVTTLVFAQGSDTVIVDHADITTMQKGKDSTNLFILEGNVVLRQGKTIFKCNRCVKNDKARTFEAWGNVHINDSDTTNIYSNHLRYLTDRQIAFLDGNVKLTDGKAVLTTPNLEYNMGTKIATYNNGGKLVNKKTVITSKEGFYYSDIKDAYFKKNVVVNDPAYNIIADSLLYNTDRQTASFISQTTIRDSANRTIKTREGFYNLRTGDAQFGQRPFINDNNKTTLNADTVNLTKDIAKASGNAVVVDSVRGTIIIGNLIYQDRNTEAVLATQKPIMIIKQDYDSIYVTADTLFSAKLTDLYVTRMISGADSLNKVREANEPALPQVVQDSLKTPDPINIKIPAQKDSTLVQSAMQVTDSLASAPKPITMPKAKISPVGNKKIQVARNLPPNADSVRVQTPVAAANPVLPPKLGSKKTPDNDSTNRYFEAFHHVKIYSDSVQAVSDSLFYSFKDSVFRFFKDPVIWGQDSQIMGDTLYLHTQNKQPRWFEAINKSMLITHLEKEAYNQIKSSRMDGYFTEGSLDSVRAKGMAQSIYFLQDEDSAYTGINQSSSDVIDAYIKNKELKKVVFRNDVKGTIYPIKQKKPREMRLEGFKWQEAIRPKSKFDILQ